MRALRTATPAPLDSWCPWSAALLTALLCFIPVSPAAATPGDDEKSTTELPDLDDAVKAEIRGKVRLRKNRIQIGYDFRKEEQAQDFAVLERFGGSQSREVEHPPIERGRLQLMRSKSIRSLAPLADITQVSLRVSGVDGFRIRLGSGEAMVTASFGRFPGISFEEGIGISITDPRSSMNLLPTKTYRLDLQILRGKAIAKLEGKKVLEERIPKDIETLDELALGLPIFSEATGGNAEILDLAITGIVAENLPLIAANRGRAEQQLPPHFENSSTGRGKHITVVSPISAEHAETWCTRLDGALGRIFEAYPADVPPPKPGGDGKGTGGEGGVDTPIDQKPIPFEYTRTISYFTDVRVLEAYSGSRGPVVTLPSGDLAQLWSWEDDRLTAILAILQREALAKLYRDLPFWWNQALLIDTLIAEEIPHLNRSVLINQSQNYIDGGANPRLSDLLGGWNWSEGKNAPTALAWTWLEFLRSGDDGAHGSLLPAYHAALRHGHSGEEAGKRVFPTAVFNELYPKFEAWLKSEESIGDSIDRGALRGPARDLDF